RGHRHGAGRPVGRRVLRAVGQERLMSTPAITLRGVGKHFAQRRSSRNVVLADVDLTIEPGEFISLVGASGCGKTTLLRMIAGLARIDAGTIHVRGEQVRGVPPRIGFVFQESALLPWKTVRENVELGLNEIRGSLAKSDAETMVDERLELVGLGSY